MNRFIILVMAALLASCSTPQKATSSHIADIPADLAAQLPLATQDFEWRFYQNALFQIPVGWNEKEIISNSNGIPIYTYGASQEDFSEYKMFEMGITVQVILGGNKLKGINASKMTAYYLKPFVDAHSKEEILLFDEKVNGAYKSTIFRYKDSANGQKPIIVHKFIIASDQTDSVDVFTFESPENTWNENWDKYGTPFLKRVMPVEVR